MAVADRAFSQDADACDVGQRLRDSQVIVVQEQKMRTRSSHLRSNADRTALPASNQRVYVSSTDVVG